MDVASIWTGWTVGAGLLDVATVACTQAICAQTWVLESKKRVVKEGDLRIPDRNLDRQDPRRKSLTGLVCRHATRMVDMNQLGL